MSRSTGAASATDAAASSWLAGVETLGRPNAAPPSVAAAILGCSSASAVLPGPWLSITAALAGSTTSAAGASAGPAAGASVAASAGVGAEGSPAGVPWKATIAGADSAVD